MARVNVFLERLTETLLVIAMLALIFCTGAQVVGRFILKVPFMWTEEGSRYCFIWIALLGTAIGVRDKSHFVIDLLSSVLPRGPKLALEVFVHIIMWIVALVLLIAGFQYAQRASIMRSASMGMSMVYVYGSAPLSGLLMVCFLAEQAPEIIARLRGRGGVRA
ncbi:MAG: Sialic acid TRAP transporter permease protein SiaT [Firmicutes bacterium ADurb.Bin506]|nr:MAG: Sialic acid TRAP transporter permease protein SiaT [Firmicutes bacterium ADurb.Bin506]